MAGNPAFVVFVDDLGVVTGATDLSGNPVQVHAGSLAGSIVGATLESNVTVTSGGIRTAKARCVWRINPATGKLECV